MSVRHKLFARRDGRTASAFELDAAGAARGSIIVLHEIWGLNEEIERVASLLAAESWHVLCPDLYDGKRPETGRDARALAFRFDADDALAQSIAGAIEILPRPIALLGFSMGGALAIAGAVVLDGLAAAVSFYGLPPIARADPRESRVPVLGHFAGDDPWCRPDRVDELEERLAGSRVAFELHRYEAAKHGFFNPSHREHFDAEASALAWRRTIAFLELHLR